MKQLSMLAVLAVLGTSAVAEDKPKPDARTTVEGYVAAALAGKVEDAAALAVADQAPSKKKRIEEIPKLLGVKKLKITTVLAGETKGEGLAVSEKVKLTKANPDGRDTGVLTFKLVNDKGKWLVRDIDFDTEAQAMEKSKQFGKKNPDAKEVPAKSKE